MADNKISEEEIERQLLYYAEFQEKEILKAREEIEDIQNKLCAHNDYLEYYTKKKAVTNDNHSPKPKTKPIK